MSTKLWISLIVVVLILSACGPRYKITYTYDPPKELNGQLCVDQCTESKTKCEHLCKQQNSDCFKKAREEASARFAVYKSRHLARKKPVRKTENDFYSDDACKTTTCNCHDDYNACFQMCGGALQPHHVCIANCKQ